jgi:hypothetical protein
MGEMVQAFLTASNVGINTLGLKWKLMRSLRTAAQSGRGCYTANGGCSETKRLRRLPQELRRLQSLSFWAPMAFSYWTPWAFSSCTPPTIVSIERYMILLWDIQAANISFMVLWATQNSGGRCTCTTTKRPRRSITKRHRRSETKRLKASQFLWQTP